MVSISVTVGIAVICIGISIVLTYLIMLNRFRESETRLKLLLDENQTLSPLRSDNERLRIENATLQKGREADAEKIEWVAGAENKLREAFQALASSALQTNSRAFIDQTKKEIDTFVKQLKGDWGTQKEEVKGIVEPLNKELEKLTKQVDEVEKKREGAYAGVLGEVRNLNQVYTDLNATTLKLQQALKSTTTRGKWGEIQLRRIAELSGMADHIDFTEQETSDVGTRPDMIIHLPNNAIIPVDAKAPMTAYLDAISANVPEESLRLLEQHRVAVRDHVKSLSRKSYWEQFSQDAAEFVVMFIPYESGLEASFAQDPLILDEALQNKVIIVSPSTLLALLKVVAYGWLQLQLAKNAREIADQGKELLERIGTFLKHFGEVGSKLNGSMESYNRAVGSLDSRVVPSLKRLREMGGVVVDLPEAQHIENRTRRSDFGESP